MPKMLKLFISPNSIDKIPKYLSQALIEVSTPTLSTYMCKVQWLIICYFVPLNRELALVSTFNCSLQVCDFSLITNSQ